MKSYNWQQPEWPRFKYDLTHLHSILIKIAEKSGLIRGKIAHLPENLQTQVMLSFMVEEAVNTSAIEGEFISRLDVRSSIKNKLGINPKNIKVQDKRAQAIVELILDNRQSYSECLTEEKLQEWHLMLFSRVYNPNLKIAQWRTHIEPMQIVSGINHRRIHYKAPPSANVANEMVQFIQWFNETAPQGDKSISFAPVRAAIAHLYFESIHPFEDGNGRIGRVISEKALSQGFGYPVILSLSQTIEADKKSYYAALHKASRSNEITPWIEYFVNVVFTAQIRVEKQITFILKKAEFFALYENKLNQRQLKVIRRMLRAGEAGFEGGMSAKKYMMIADTSKATATRDLHQLAEMGIFSSTGSGPSVRYELTW